MTLTLLLLAYGAGAGATARSIDGRSLPLDVLAWACWPALWVAFAGACLLSLLGLRGAQ